MDGYVCYIFYLHGDKGRSMHARAAAGIMISTEPVVRHYMGPTYHGSAPDCVARCMRLCSYIIVVYAQQALLVLASMWVSLENQVRPQTLGVKGRIHPEVESTATRLVGMVVCKWIVHADTWNLSLPGVYRRVRTPEVPSHMQCAP